MISPFLIICHSWEKLGNRLLLLSGRVVCVATLPVMASRFGWGSWFKSAINMPWSGRVNELFSGYFNFDFIPALALVALHASFVRLFSKF